MRGAKPRVRRRRACHHHDPHGKSRRQAAGAAARGGTRSRSFTRAGSTDSGTLACRYVFPLRAAASLRRQSHGSAIATRVSTCGDPVRRVRAARRLQGPRVGGHAPRPGARGPTEDSERLRLINPRNDIQFLRCRAMNSSTAWYQATALRGLRIQWFSSGKMSSSLGTPWYCSASKRFNPSPTGQR